MKFRTEVDINKPSFTIEPEDELLFLGSCFADNIGQRFVEQRLRATVNPRGTMYNPASILHTLQLCPELRPRVAFLTLGTNHVYRLRETGEIVDNCQKRPANLFEEEELTVEACSDYLRQCVDVLRTRRPDVHVVLTVSPIRYRKYGYHASQLSKATLLLAIEHLISQYPAVDIQQTITYFPAYEIVLDELRDYRFYQPDMLHPSEQAVEYIYEQLAERYFSQRLKEFLRLWAPIHAALQHRPFNADSKEYKDFMQKTQEQLDALRKSYPLLPI
jgi:lysophospholipase L1-like esterase